MSGRPQQRPQQQQQQQPQHAHADDHHDDDEEILFTEDDFNVRQPIVIDGFGDGENEGGELQEVPLFSGGAFIADATTSSSANIKKTTMSRTVAALIIPSPPASSTTATTATTGSTNTAATSTTRISSSTLLSSSSSLSSSLRRSSNNTPVSSNKSNNINNTERKAPILKKSGQQQQSPSSSSRSNNKHNTPPQSQQVLSTFDPYKSPVRGASAASSTATLTTPNRALLDSSVEEEETDDEDDDDNEIDVESVAIISETSMRRKNPQQQQQQENAFLEMESEFHNHDDPLSLGLRTSSSSSSSGGGGGSIQRNYNTSGLHDGVQTSSGLFLTHRRTPVPSSSSSPNNSSVAATTATTSRTQAQDYYYGGNSSFSAFSTSNNRNSNNITAAGAKSGTLRTARFEVENPWSAISGGNNGGDSFLRQAQRMLSFVRVWVLLSALILFVGTTVVLHHIRHGQHSTATDATTVRSNTFQVQQQQDGSTRLILPIENGQQQQQQQDLSSSTYNYADAFGAEATTDRVVLLPLSPEMIQQQQNYNHHHQQQQQQQHHFPGHRVLRELRSEFEEWVHHHGKRYHSHDEKERRFNIWAHNHERTRRKNQEHGPCKLTGKAVFGSNHFKDLTRDEFQEQYLNSKSPPPVEEERQRRRRRARATTTASVLKPPPPLLQQSEEHDQNENNNESSLPTAPIYHPEVHRRIEATWSRPRVMGGGSASASASSSSKSYNCAWYDVSCILQYIFEKFVYGFYGIGTTMEPAYDSNSYPTAVDWRDVGAVTDVRTQDGCGACWAITAIETVESAVFLSYGTLYDLSETEVIVCAEECEMCDGGWPEDAFDYIMEHNGVPLANDMSYDGDWLLSVSNTRSGASDEIDSYTLQAYMGATCPNGGGGGSGSGSGSGSQDYAYYGNGNDDGGYGFTQNTFSRYGNIDGYGYATERCVCYTDGTGCDCDDQDEGLAVGNLATYGPAVVCIDAADWQDYEGGILTSSSGCSAKFLDVNHCVQVVGYAFTNGYDDDQGGGGGGQQSGSGSGSGSGSQDDADREGYWIVRNQWSAYWGMNGYAYVAMGENTCGILNNVIQAYTK